MGAGPAPPGPNGGLRPDRLYYNLAVRYLIQFPAGATPLVERAVQEDFANVTAEYGDESALVFESSTRIKTADSVPYAKNVFEVHAQTPRKNALAQGVTRIAANIHKLRVPRNPPGFRIMYHIDGQLQSCEPKARQALERAVASASGLRLTPRGQCQEFWVIGRRESQALYFAQRLPSTDSRARAKGALSVELSALLVAASHPSPNEVFLDPFAGSGALVAARLRTPAKSIIYNDLALGEHRAAFPPALSRNRNVLLLSEDALELPSIETGSVDIVVTDPPWGEHDEEMGDYGKFSQRVATSLARVLKPNGGRAVVLVNRRNEGVLTDALETYGFDVFDGTQILVSGHPATAIHAGH